MPLLRKFRHRRIEKRDELASVHIDTKLDALNEAAGFFSGSLYLADGFRLVSSRIADLMPFQTIALFLLNESRDKLISIHTVGKQAEHYKAESLDLDAGLAGRAYNTRKVEITNPMDLQRQDTLAAAIPLKHGENVFGVLQLNFGQDFDVGQLEMAIVEGIGERIAPLMLGSIAYERSQTNALTDATTDLPSERAFYLVLENQVAEAHGRRGERPLTILALDIKNFEEVNRMFGHAAGDRVLNFVAHGIRNSVRQMDFVARSRNDEFLVILPTAGKEISEDIVARIQNDFAQRKLPINDTQSVEIELSVGWAEFAGDGETPDQLLRVARLRKEQIKAQVPSNVLWFPQGQPATVLQFAK